MGESSGRISANAQIELGRAYNIDLACDDPAYANPPACGPSIQAGAETRYRLTDTRGPIVEAAVGAAGLFQDTGRASGSLLPSAGVYVRDGAFELGAVGGPRFFGPLGYQVGAIIAYQLKAGGGDWTLRLNLGVNGTDSRVGQDQWDGYFDDVVVTDRAPDTNFYFRGGVQYRFWTS